MPRRIRIAWVDHCQLTRECVTTALSLGASQISAKPYETLIDLITECGADEIDLVVLFAHSLAEQSPQQIAALRRAGFEQPIILVTEDDAADQISAVRTSLRLGASGHLSTRSTGLQMAITSFAFAYEGGTFAPLTLLVSPESQPRMASLSRAAGRPGAADAKPPKIGKAGLAPGGKSRSFAEVPGEEAIDPNQVAIPGSTSTAQSRDGTS